MTHFNSKEEAFKDLLGGLDFDLDTDAIWNSVEDQLPKKEEGPRLPLFIWGLSFIVIGLLGFVVFQKPSIGEEQAISETHSSSELLTKSLTSSRALELALDNVADRIAAAKTLDSKNLKSKETALLINSNNTTNNILQHEPIVRTTSSNNMASPLVVSNTTSLSSGITSYSKPAAPISTNLSKLLLDPLAPLGHLVSYLSFPAEEAYEVKNLDALVIEPLSLTSEREWNSYFTILTGASKNISSFSSAETSKLLEYESDLLGLSTDFSYGVNNGLWKFFGGLRHSYNASRFSNHDLSADSKDIPVETQHILGNGETESRAGFITETTITQNAIDWHRIHQNVDLNLGLGRSLIKIKNFEISGEGSIIYNVWSRISGYYYGNNFSELTTFVSGEDNPYKTSIGLGAQFAISIEQQIGTQTSIMLRPFYGKYFSPITEENISYRIKNSQIGLQIGISYRPTGS